MNNAPRKKLLMQGIPGGVAFLVLRFVFGVDSWISFIVAILVSTGVYLLVIARNDSGSTSKLDKRLGESPAPETTGEEE